MGDYRDGFFEEDEDCDGEGDCAPTGFTILAGYSFEAPYLESCCFKMLKPANGGRVFFIETVKGIDITWIGAFDEKVLYIDPREFNVLYYCVCSRDGWED